MSAAGAPPIEGAIWHGWNHVPDEAMQALHDRIFGLAGNGGPLGALFDGFGDEAAFNGKIVLTNALAAGVNPRTVASTLAAALDTSQNRALTIARNELVDAYRNAQLENYRANSDVMRGWMWSAAPGCCVACAFMDGSTHDLDEDMDSHVMCRCSPLPITKSWDDILGPLGADVSNIADTSILIGYEPMLDNFADWSVADQVAMLGPAKWGAWAQGDIELADLVGVRDDGAWGNPIYEKSLKELGLDARDYLGKNASVPFIPDEIAPRIDPGAIRLASQDLTPGVQQSQKALADAQAEMQKAVGLTPEQFAQADLRVTDVGASNRTYLFDVDGVTYFAKASALPETAGDVATVSEEVAAALKQAANQAASAAAQDMGRILGLDEYLVPQVQMERDGVVYEVSQWLQGQSLQQVRDLSSEQAVRDALLRIPQADREQLTLFEYLIGDLDRHPGNYLLLDDGQVKAIDFGLAFFNRGVLLDPYDLNTLLKYGFVDGWSTHLDPALLRDFLDQAQALREVMTTYSGPIGASTSQWGRGGAAEIMAVFDRRLQVIERLAELDDPTLADWNRISQEEARRLSSQV